MVDSDRVWNVVEIADDRLEGFEDALLAVVATVPVPGTGCRIAFSIDCDVLLSTASRVLSWVVCGASCEIVCTVVGREDSIGGGKPDGAVVGGCGFWLPPMASVGLFAKRGVSAAGTEGLAELDGRLRVDVEVEKDVEVEVDEVDSAEVDSDEIGSDRSEVGTIDAAAAEVVGTGRTEVELRIEAWTG